MANRLTGLEATNADAQGIGIELRLQQTGLTSWLDMGRTKPSLTQTKHQGIGSQQNNEY